MKILLLISALFFSTASFAQPSIGTTYAETKRRADEKAYNDAYNEANRQNWNKPTANSAARTGKSEMQIWIEGRQEARKARAEAVRRAQEDERAKKESEDKEQDAHRSALLEMSARINREIAEKEASERAWWLTLPAKIKEVQQSGLSTTDAYTIVVRTMPLPDGSYNSGGDTLRSYLKGLPQLFRRVDSLAAIKPYKQLRPLLFSLANPNSEIPSSNLTEVGAVVSAARILTNYLIKNPTDTLLCRDALTLCRLFFTYTLSMTISSEEDRLLMLDLYTMAAPFNTDLALFAAMEVGYNSWKMPFFQKRYGFGFPGKSFNMLLQLAIANTQTRLQNHFSWEVLGAEDLKWYLGLFKEKLENYEKGEYIFQGTKYKVVE